MGNRDAVVIELDSAPTALNVPTSGDYLERCVVSALFRPALRLLSASRGSDYFEFDVADGQRFSDGSAVQPRHVLQTLIAGASSSQWARQIAYLEKAEIIGDRLCLSMRRPACFFPDMLRTVDFAPTHPDGLGNGPYRIGDEFDADRGYYHLTPNPHVEDSDERPELVFRLQTDVDGAPERFLRGESDITCNTAFPLDRLDEWRGNSAMHRAPTGIYMQVEPNPSGEGPLANPSLRRAMSGCLDLAAIAASFPGGLAARFALRGVGSACGRTSRRGCASAITTSIRIAPFWRGSACSGAIGWEWTPNSSSETMQTGERMRRMDLSFCGTFRSTIRMLTSISVRR